MLFATDSMLENVSLPKRLTPRDIEDLIRELWRAMKIIQLKKNKINRMVLYSRRKNLPKALLLN